MGFNEANPTTTRKRPVKKTVTIRAMNLHHNIIIIKMRVAAAAASNEGGWSELGLGGFIEAEKKSFDVLIEAEMNEWILKLK